MFRKYTTQDYGFVLNSLVHVQKQINMDVAPICGKSMRNKREACARFLKKLIVPNNKCYIAEENGDLIGFTCFKPTGKGTCFIEFFVKAPDLRVTPKHVKILKNHIQSVKKENGYKTMFAIIANRKNYNRWLDISKRFLNPKSVSLQKENHHLLEF